MFFFPYSFGSLSRRERARVRGFMPRYAS